MIKIENVEVCGLEPTIRGMRNPMNSWDKSDSGRCEDICCTECSVKINSDGCHAITNIGDGYVLGPKDLYLGTKLSIGGPVHAKYRRMITVYMDIVAPLYWWKEFDTYKVGTVANSCSTMHKIHEKEFTLEDFSCEHLFRNSLVNFKQTIEELNYWRNVYINGGEDCITDEWEVEHFEPNDKSVWWQLIQLLPSSYNQRRTIMLNYEVLHNIYTSRRAHKLDEWREFCEFIVKELPYSVIFTTGYDSPLNSEEV